MRSFTVHEGERWRSRDGIGNDKRSVGMNIGYSVSCSCHRNQPAQPLTSPRRWFGERHHGAYGLVGLPRRALTVEGTHQDAEIEACDVYQIALVAILASAEPSPTHAAAMAKDRSTSSPPGRIVSRPIPDLNRIRLA
jgi:hypothetical protein